MTDQPSDLQVRDEPTTKQEPTNTKQGTSARPHNPKMAAVLEARAAKLTVTGAARAAGVGRRTIYDWRAADPEFARALDEAHTEAVEVLKESVYERAFKDPILAMFVIKANDPQYNDKVQAARAFAEAQGQNPILQLQAAILAKLQVLEDAGQLPRRRGDPPIIEGQSQPVRPSEPDNPRDDGVNDGGGHA